MQFDRIDNIIAPMQGFNTRPEEFKRSMKNQRVSAIACLCLAVASAYSQAAAQQDRTTVQIQNLIEKLSTNDDKTRFEAFQSLSKIGSAAVPALVEVLNQGRGYGRVYAARTLRKIEPNN